MYLWCLLLLSCRSVSYQSSLRVWNVLMVEHVRGLPGYCCMSPIKAIATFSFRWSHKLSPLGDVCRNFSLVSRSQSVRLATQLSKQSIMSKSKKMMSDRVRIILMWRTIYHIWQAAVDRHFASNACLNWASLSEEHAISMHHARALLAQKSVFDSKSMQQISYSGIIDQIIRRQSLLRPESGPWEKRKTMKQDFFEPNNGSPTSIRPAQWASEGHTFTHCSTRKFWQLHVGIGLQGAMSY